MNELRALDRVLSDAEYRSQCEIHVDPELGQRAKLPWIECSPFKPASPELSGFLCADFECAG